MASAGGVLSKEQLLCPICLDVFRLPVSTPCGHNFCRDCIQRYWQSPHLAQCPVCKHRFYMAPDLKVNTFISEVASHFTENECVIDAVDQAAGEVSCDVCIGKRVKAECERARRFAVDVTLDSESAHPKLVISENKKEVYHGDVAVRLPADPQRFYPCVSVLGKEGFSSGRFYFEVQVKGKTEWDVGVALESAQRKGGNWMNPDRGYWTLGMREEGKYWALSSPPVCVPLVDPPQRVGVYVDLGWGQVSFYNPDSLTHIYSFTGYSFSGRLLPHLNPHRNHSGVNSAPLIILPVNM